MPRILLLGSGYVASPFVDFMVKRPENIVTVASRKVEHVQALVRGRENQVKTAIVDVHNEAQLDEAVSQHDIVISLIPYTYHALVIKSAIKYKKHVCTTSYVSPAMAELDTAAKEAGIVVMNEIGVDPGVDHVYALKVIHEIHEAGGKILSFTSYCGGLPAPEASDNPLGYKFSWSPRGVLLAARNTARFKEGGKVVEIPGHELLKKGAKRIRTVYPAFAVEGYPNRDSTPYEQRYNIPEAETIIRGTLRYDGNPTFIQALADLGFLNDEARDWLAPSQAALSWRTVLAKILDVQPEESVLAAAITQRINLEASESARVLSGMRWIGLLSDELVEMRGTYLDTLCATLERKLVYKEGERDMVLLQHTFEIEHKDGRRETRTSTLLEYGVPNGDTAMARTVGVPCAIATQMILDGELTRTGVIAPMTPDVFMPLLYKLQAEGIECFENSVFH
eukprot:Colp12_sorted_trinity150504_noHs@422